MQSFEDASLKQFNYHFENDFIFQTDKYYTHGNKLEWVFENKDKKTLYNFNIKQSMYTPRQHSLSYVAYGDMPYSGVAEFELGVHKQTQTMQLSLDFGLGYTGQYSYAKESMELVHSLLPTNPEFNGWSHQKDTTLLSRISTTYKYKAVLKEHFLDTIFHCGVNIGNLRSSLYTGVQLRVGENLDDGFGLYSAYSNNLNYKSLNSQKQKNIYFVVGANAQYIYNDMTLEGDGVSMLHTQASLNTGFSSQYKSLNFSMLATLETKRFRSQDREYFGYADITIGWKY